MRKTEIILFPPLLNCLEPLWKLCSCSLLSENKVPYCNFRATIACHWGSTIWCWHYTFDRRCLSLPLWTMFNFNVIVQKWTISTQVQNWVQVYPLIHYLSHISTCSRLTVDIWNILESWEMYPQRLQTLWLAGSVPSFPSMHLCYLLYNHTWSDKLHCHLKKTGNDLATCFRLCRTLYIDSTRKCKWNHRITI